MIRFLLALSLACVAAAQPEDPANPSGDGPEQKNASDWKTLQGLPWTVAGPETQPAPELNPGETVESPTPIASSDQVPAQREPAAPLIIVVTNSTPPLDPRVLLEATRASIEPAVETLNARLNSLEGILIAQGRAADKAAQVAAQANIQLMGGVVAAVVLSALAGALILARAIKKTSETLLRAAPFAPALNFQPGGNGPEAAGLPVLSDAEPRPIAHGYLAAIEQLEKRVDELEHTVPSSVMEAAGAAIPDPAKAPNGKAGPLEFSVSALHEKQYGPSASSTQPVTRSEAEPASLWMGKGQALLNLGLAEDALDCFDRAIELNPESAADAYVKRGMALERLEQLEAAVENYDRAIAADRSMTLAYLYKGAACNRLQRYRDALDCYDQAIRCEQKNGRG